MKDKSKLINVITNGLCIVMYFVIILSILLGSKLGYALVFIVSAMMSVMMWKVKINLIKVLSYVMTIYSFMAFWGLHIALVEKSNNFLLNFVMVILEMCSIHYSKVVVIVLITMLILARYIIAGIRISIANVIYKSLPNVSRIVKKTRKVYFYKDVASGQIQLVFRNGSKKKILDTYELGPEHSKQHYSMEWEEEKELVVRKYDLYNHKVLMEKSYKVPKY